jgi:translation initiation factor IF-3
MAHQEIGRAVLERVKVDLATMAHVDMEPKMAGRALGMTLSPLPANKRKRRFTAPEEEYVEDVHEHDDDEAEENAAP